MEETSISPLTIHFLVLVLTLIAGFGLLLILFRDYLKRNRGPFKPGMVIFRYENETMKLSLSIIIIGGMILLKTTGFTLCEFLSYWLPSLFTRICR